MPDMSGYDEFDSIWVYWPPDKLAVWSSATREWVDIIFAGNPEEQSTDEHLSLIQSVELSYIFATGIDASPYVFDIQFL